MSRRYVLAPEAAHDLVQIWRYIKKNASNEMADRVESVIREKIVYLAGRPESAKKSGVKPPWALAPAFVVAT
jgi:plasmid stabilization system protein ParE